MTLFGSLAEPFRGLGMVLRHPLAVLYMTPKVELRRSMILDGSLVEPLRGLGGVLRRAPTIGVHGA